MTDNSSELALNKSGSKANKVIDSIKWEITPDQIAQQCDQVQNQLKQKIDDIVAANGKTFENILKPLELNLADFSDKSNKLTFYADVSADKNLRDVSQKCKDTISKMLVDIYMREDLYTLVKSLTTKQKSLDEDQKLLLKDYMDGFEENGLSLPMEKRKRLEEIKKELVQLESDYNQVLGNWNEVLHFTKQELEGMTEDFIHGLDKSSEDGKDYVVTLKYPHVFPIFDEAKNSETRRKVYVAFNQRGGAENSKKLGQAIQLRQELAELLGFTSYAQLVLKRRMAQNPEAVEKFLNGVKAYIAPLALKDYATLEKFKQNEIADPKAKLNSWDIRYYINQVRKKDYDIDQDKIAEYFPIDVVIKGMFHIYETLLSVKFVELKDHSVWNPDVKLYAIYNNQKNSSDKKDKVIGQFYMDLSPREGKYGHAAAFSLNQGYTRLDGEYSVPVAAIVANFTKATEVQPSLLKHSEVETLFHEFGHIMHQTLTRARYVSQSGTSVQLDFVEAPSQMLENWVWKAETLKILSGHYKTHEPLPDDLIKKMVRSKNVFAPLFYVRQAFFASIDMAYHNGKHVHDNITQLWIDTWEDATKLKELSGIWPEASFGHIMGGYQAGYYGYMWSKVFSESMFKRFEKQGLMSPEAGADYRKWILEPGSGRKADEILKKFIGHPPSIQDFLKTFDQQKSE